MEPTALRLISHGHRRAEIARPLNQVQWGDSRKTKEQLLAGRSGGGGELFANGAHTGEWLDGAA